MQPILLSLMLILPSQLAAEKPKVASANNDEALRSSVAASAKDFSGRCEFTVGESGHTKLVLHPEPILRWSNPTVGQVFGEVFVWTDNGRPAIVASWYRWYSPDWGRTFEICSLAPGRAAGRVNDIQFWNTDKAGLTLKPLANADAPAKVAAARLVQMRRIAGDFVAHLADTRGDDSGVKRQLRLLPQPVFRYPAAKEKATYADGALFTFVEGTDPEAFLMLEATKTNEDVIWQFGLARMNGDALRVTFRDKDVWTVPKIENPLNLAKEPYALITSEHVIKVVGL
ncbi:MAG: hypothetical protein IAG10_03780, partial [Planctomycetaceae bacterium]|nr:hypothetical protein [Planctomycetaceae bacterium]